MKTIGLIGGTGYLSTIEYYKIINETINKKLGGLNFARCILYSFNYGDIDTLNKKDNMKEIYNLLLDAATKTIGSGAECIVLCANALHYCADELQKNIGVPLINIAAEAAAHVKRKQLSTVGLLGTKQTMEHNFYKSKLSEKGIEVLVPDTTEREFINNIIINELLTGKFRNKSKEGFVDIIKRLERFGAEGIIVGCTEIPLLISQEDTNIPLFNTLIIHAQAAVNFALND
jgi:aspartate racemase